MTTKYWGIDPGASGAIAMIRPGDNPTIIASSFRRLPKELGKPNIAVADVIQLLEDYHEPGDILTFERVGNSSPQGRKQGATSMFSFGMATGLALGAVARFFSDDEMIYVMPSVWKRALGLLKRPKGDSYDVACELYPNWSPLDGALHTGPSVVGRSDALLLAHYGMAFGAERYLRAAPQ